MSHGFCVPSQSSHFPSSCFRVLVCVPSQSSHFPSSCFRVLVYVPSQSSHFLSFCCLVLVYVLSRFSHPLFSYWISTVCRALFHDVLPFSYSRYAPSLVFLR